MHKLFSIVLLLFASVAHGQVPLELKGDVKVVKVDRVVVVKEDLLVVQSLPFTIQAPSGGGLYFWSYPAGVVAQDAGNVLKVTEAPQGAVTVSVKRVGVKLDKDGKFLDFETTLGSTSFSVGLPSPKPPEPDPKPKPPEPVLDPSPFPVTGFRVLFIVESGEPTKLTKDQYNSLYGQTSRDWLDQTTVREGKQPAYWIVDPQQNIAGLPAYWADARAKALATPGFTTPWILVGNGKNGFSGPMPKTMAEIKAKLEPYSK